MSESMEIVRIDENVAFPQRGTAESAGLDCLSTRLMFLKPGATQFIELCIRITFHPD